MLVLSAFRSAAHPETPEQLAPSTQPVYAGPLDPAHCSVCGELLRNWDVPLKRTCTLCAFPSFSDPGVARPNPCAPLSPIPPPTSGREAPASNVATTAEPSKISTEI